jgi:hypothetical protein
MTKVTGHRLAEYAEAEERVLAANGPPSPRNPTPVGRRYHSPAALRHHLGVSVATFMLLLDISGCP